MLRRGDFSPRPLSTSIPFNFKWSGCVKPNKLEAKQLYFGYSLGAEYETVNEACLVLWSKELDRNIMLRGYTKIGMFLGVSTHGVAMPHDFVKEGFELGIDWFIAKLKIALKNSGDLDVILIEGGSHPVTPELWFNGYEMQACWRE
jgi:hypothetical protein